MNEFWAAIAGAIVGSISSGGVTWFLQRGQLQQQSSERNEGLARSLLFKVIKIHSDLYNLRDLILECKNNAKDRGLPIGWQSIQPPSSLPAKITFEADEMGFFLSLKKDDLFNRLMSLDNTHSSILENFSLYSQRRMALTDMLPAVMQGTIGEAVLNDQQLAMVAPRAAELSQLIEDIDGQLEKYVPQAKSTLVGVNQAIGDTIGRGIDIRFDDDIAH